MPWLREVPAVQILGQIWVQQFSRTDQSITWRSAEDLPPAALMISSPHDVQARYGKKRSTEWTGYKVHVTETCDADRPHVITDVETTPAPTSDCVLIPVLQDHLAARHVLPAEHIVDAGYVSASHLETSQRQHGIDLVAPAPAEPSWQAKAGQGFAASQFQIDWDHKQATCPQGHGSVQWMPGHDRHDHDILNIRYQYSLRPCRLHGVSGPCLVYRRKKPTAHDHDSGPAPV